jgi:hypothetical protein
LYHIHIYIIFIYVCSDKIINLLVNSIIVKCDMLRYKCSN